MDKLAGIRVDSHTIYHLSGWSLTFPFNRSREGDNRVYLRIATGERRSFADWG